MSDIGQRYAVPAEIDQFVDQGFLEVLTERPDRMTVEFHIPSRVTVDHRRRITAYRIVWIHPAHNRSADHDQGTSHDVKVTRFFSPSTSDWPRGGHHALDE